MLARQRIYDWNFRALAFICLAVVVGLWQQASAQEPWDLAVCVPVAAFPAADRDRGGYDVEIAELLADELGATATFTWFQFDDIGMRDHLHAGVCDVAMGVTEGMEDMLTTVAYLRAPYVFVTLAERDLDIESLDDPDLRELEIGTYPFSLPSMALANRDIVDNVSEYASVITPTGADTHTPVLDAVLGGEVDVGIVYGPAAAGRALDEPGLLTLVPVTPEVDFGPTLLQLSRILTMGVRAHDEALRDDLNRALAHRWEDMLAILDEYGVPRLSVATPVDVGELEGDAKVGVIVPARTPASLANAPIGEDALRGSTVAENAISVAGGTATTPFRVLNAHAPSLASVARAAARLIQVDGVDALVGGYQPASARAIAEVAAANGVPYFNVGSEDIALRDSACYPSTFHVAPSAAMTISAMVQTASTDGPIDVFAVVESGSGAEGLVSTLTESLSSNGGAIAGEARTEPDQFVFFPVLEMIRESGADTVFMLMSSEAQEVFMSQAPAMIPDVSLIGMATVRGQSRPYLQRFMQVAPEGDPQPRVVVWDPALDSPVNATFAARTGEPMEPAAWTTYAAIVTVFQAAQAGALGTLDELRTYLSDPASAIDVGKASDVIFRDSDGQLLQELYVVEAVEGASWGRTAAVRTSIGQVTAVLPVEATSGAALDVPAACEAP